MPIPTNIKTLLSCTVVESARIEFKKSWKPEASLKTICAFANDLDNWGGGYIVIGVEENEGLPVYPLCGVPLNQVDATMKDLLNKCKMIVPEYLPVVELIDYQGVKLITIWCPGGATRPYKSPAEFTYKSGKAVPSKEKIYYIRKMSSTVVPSTSEITDLFSLANQVPFDDRINHEAELSDLNITLIKSYLKDIGSDLYDVADKMPFPDLCASLGISSNLPEYLKPKNVGLMFFYMNPDRFIPYAQIEVVEFPQGDGGDEIIENIFQGPLHQQLQDVLRYLRNTIIKELVIKHPAKAEAERIFNYPYSAVEEALANAVYHKGYDVREPIEVRIEPEFIEIISHPGPDRSITQAKLKSGRVSNRRYRNRRIGEFLKELHLTEGRNTGFGKIKRAMEQNGSPAPEFEMDDEYTYFITRLKVSSKFQNISKTSPKHQNEVLGINKRENDLVVQLLRLIAEQPGLGQKVLAQRLGVSLPKVQRVIKSLKEVGRLQRVGGKRYGEWKINS